MHFAGSNPATDRKTPKCIYKNSKSIRVEKTGEISRNLPFSRRSDHRTALSAARIYGWDSRTRTCKARVKVSCVAVTPYPIGIVRTPGKGAFVRSFGIITQRGFLVNIPDSHSGGRRSGQGYRTRGQYPRRENGCGGRVRFVGYLRRVRLGLMCAISGQCEQRGA